MKMEDAEEFPVEADENEGKGKDGKKERPVIRTAVDLQRLKLEKLMKNPDKPVIIPESHREKDFLQSVPSFVRNVMGSSAGAGSGEFHVYRHLRRKEYARQKYIQAKSVREQLDDDFRNKLEQNKMSAEEKTAKKRAKRLKKKQKSKQRGKIPKLNSEIPPNEESSDESSENDENVAEKDDDPDEKISSEIVAGPQANTDDTKNINETEEENNISEVCVQQAVEISECQLSTASTKPEEICENDEKLEAPTNNKQNEKSDKESNDDSNTGETDEINTSKPDKVNVTTV